MIVPLITPSLNKVFEPNPMKYSGKISKPFLILLDNICLSAQI